MRNTGYLVMLIFTFLGSIWLQIFLKVRVLQQVRRLVMTIFPVLTIFMVWDFAAISMSHWTFDSQQMLPLKRFFGIPVEEIIFFLVVPLATILTFEAVRKSKPRWGYRK